MKEQEEKEAEQKAATKLSDVILRRPHLLIPDIFSSKDLLDKMTAIQKPPEDTSEKNVAEFLATLISPSKERFPIWRKTKINLWELAKKLGEVKYPKDAREKYMHPLQPDIDILYGPIFDRSESAPLVGIELKVFSETVGPGKTIPKTHLPFEGYYAGLDEASALLLMGLDYVYLWHIMVVPIEVWESYRNKYGEEFESKLIHEHGEFARAYQGCLEGMIRSLGVPLGCASHGLLVFQNEWSLCPVGEIHLAPPNPLRDNYTPQQVRTLILRGLNLQEH